MEHIRLYLLIGRRLPILGVAESRHRRVSRGRHRLGHRATIDTRRGGAQRAAVVVRIPEPLVLDDLRRVKVLLLNALFREVGKIIFIRQGSGVVGATDRGFLFHELGVLLGLHLFDSV